VYDVFPFLLPWNNLKCYWIFSQCTYLAISVAAGFNGFNTIISHWQLQTCELFWPKSQKQAPSAACDELNSTNQWHKLFSIIVPLLDGHNMGAKSEGKGTGVHYGNSLDANSCWVYSGRTAGV